MALTWVRNLDNNPRTKMTISKNFKICSSSVPSLFPKLLQFMILKESSTLITTQVLFLSNKCTINNNYISNSINKSNSQALASSPTLLSSNSSQTLANNNNSLSSLNSNNSSLFLLNSNWIHLSLLNINSSSLFLLNSSKQILVSRKKPNKMCILNDLTHSKDSRLRQRRPKTISHSTQPR